MQFQVPQFIEVEDKIFGRLTFRQFIYVVGGGGGAYLLVRVLPQFIGFPLALAVAAFALALAFMQINGRPFVVAVENAFFYTLNKKLYLWSSERPTQANVQASKPADAQAKALFVPTLSSGKLRDLAWSLDIQERVKEGMSMEEIRARGSAPTDAMNSAAVKAAKNEALSAVLTSRSALRSR